MYIDDEASVGLARAISEIPNWLGSQRRNLEGEEGDQRKGPGVRRS